MVTSLFARALATSSLIALMTLGLTGCSLSTTSADDHWEDTAALRSSTDGAQVPSLVDSDATGIDLHVPQISGATVLRWTSERGITRSDCEAGPVEPTSSDAPWWPKTLPAKGWTCGWWTVYSSDGRFFASKRTQSTSGS